jgi:hypothetical protein
MKSKNLIFMIIVMCVALSGQLAAEEIVGESIFPNIRTPRFYPKPAKLNSDLGTDKKNADVDTLIWSTTIREPGAAWIKIHFSEFRLSPDDFVVLVGTDGRVIDQFSGRDISEKNSSKFKVIESEKNTFSFWGLAVAKDEVIIELYRTLASNNEKDWGFTIDEVGIGCRPVFDRGLGPVYNTEVESVVPFIPSCHIDPTRGELNYGANVIDILDSPLGRMLYRRGITWYSCKIFPSAIQENHIVPGEPVVDSQELVDTIEVKFYCRYFGEDDNFSVCFTYCADIFIGNYFSSDYNTFTIKNNHRWLSPIFNDVNRGENLDLLSIYAATDDYCWASMTCHGTEKKVKVSCPGGTIKIKCSTCYTEVEASCSCTE